MHGTCLLRGHKVPPDIALYKASLAKLQLPSADPTLEQWRTFLQEAISLNRNIRSLDLSKASSDYNTAMKLILALPERMEHIKFIFLTLDKVDRHVTSSLKRDAAETDNGLNESAQLALTTNGKNAS